MTNGEYMKASFTHEQRTLLSCLGIALTDVCTFSAWLDEEHKDGNVQLTDEALKKKEETYMPRMLTFGEAIDRCKQGSKISRLGWNGKGQYVELAARISYVNARGETVNADHEAIGNNALAFVGTSGVQIGWLASQADMLAVDWVDVTESVSK